MSARRSGFNMHTVRGAAFLAAFTFGATAMPITDAQGTPDPTRPPVTGAPAEPEPDSGKTPIDWRLSSTLISAGRRVAVINGVRVSRGDTVRGARVVDIEPGRVMLERDGKRFTVSLLAASIKRVNEPANGQ